MDDVAQNKKPVRTRWIKSVLLLLAILASPALCCGGLYLLAAIPSDWVPDSVDFLMFRTDARVENHTSETLYLTAITTTYPEPMIISQNIAFRQRDIPVGPQGAVVLQYDPFDFPLGGIAVCRKENDCRLLPENGASFVSGVGQVFVVNSYASLENLDPAWQEAINSEPVYDFSMLYFRLKMAVLCLLPPILLFSSWLYLNRREKQEAG